MIIGPLFCYFWGTLVDVKKVIDVHSCLKAHIQHINIIIWLVVPYYLMWTIWWDWNTWTYIHVVPRFFWGLFTFMIVILYEALYFNATLLYQTHFSSLSQCLQPWSIARVQLRKDLCQKYTIIGHAITVTTIAEPHHHHRSPKLFLLVTRCRVSSRGHHLRCHH